VTAKGLKGPALPARQFLPLDVFLQAARAAGVDVTRRTLQYYYSPRIRLLPPPTYRGGHVAYVERGQLHRLKAIKTLQSRYGLSLGAIRELLEAVSDTGIRSLAEGRAHPLSAQIVLHHLRLRNAHRRAQERALFETMILLVEWHAWDARNPVVSRHRPSLCPRPLDKDTELEVRGLISRLIQHINRGGSHTG
jgi:DNA-binding transcriptional MerR regulator